MVKIHKVSTGLEALQHDVGHGATVLAGKESIMLLNGGPVIATTGSAGAILGSLGPKLGVIAGVGLTTALSAALTQMSYNYQLHSMRKLYAEEMAAKLGKSVEQLNDRDLERLAKGDAAKNIPANKTIADALKKEKRIRNIGIVVSIVASLASFAMLNFAVNQHMFEAMTGLMRPIAKAAAAMVAYHLIKAPMDWASLRLAGLHKDTAHDRILDIEKEHEKGRIISHEQVLDVFVKSNTELAAMIQSHYGKPFEKLSLATRQDITAQLAPVLQLDRLVTDINEGRMNATELAFTVEGQASGVQLRHAPELPEKPTFGNLVRESFSKIAGHFRKPQLRPETPVPAAKEIPVAAFAPQAAETAPVISHVERLQQQRATTSEQLQR
jgi:hypothetical protein